MLSEVKYKFRIFLETYFEHINPEECDDLNEVPIISVIEWFNITTKEDIDLSSGFALLKVGGDMLFDNLHLRPKENAFNLLPEDTKKAMRSIFSRELYPFIYKDVKEDIKLEALEIVDNISTVRTFLDMFCIRSKNVLNPDYCTEAKYPNLEDLYNYLELFCIKYKFGLVEKLELRRILKSLGYIPEAKYNKISKKRGTYYFQLLIPNNNIEIHRALRYNSFFMQKKSGRKVLYEDIINHRKELYEKEKEKTPKVLRGNSRRADDLHEETVFYGEKTDLAGEQGDDSDFFNTEGSEFFEDVNPEYGDEYFITPEATVGIKPNISSEGIPKDFKRRDEEQSASADTEQGFIKGDDISF